MKKICQGLGKLLLATSCFVSIANAQTFLTNGLISYYPFNGDASDKIGSNHGVATGATLASDMFGRPNRAYSFDGTNSWITAPDTGFPDANSPRTISLWALSQNFGSNPSLVSYGTVGPSSAFYAVTLTAGRPDAPILSVGRSGGGDTPQAPQTVGTQLNRWYHIVLSHDGSETKLYVDGVLQGTTARIYSTSLTGTFQIGAYDTPECCDAVHKHHGLIDNVRVYNRALSDDEVFSLYAFESTPSLPLQIEVASVRLKWPSEAGAGYEIQYSSAFQDWTVLETVLGTGETLEYVDEVAGERRFYRIIKE